jgi:hypothetical protein
MSDNDLLTFILLVWAGVATGLYLDAKRDVKMTKHVILTLVRDKEERERFFMGFEKMLEGKFND